MNLLRLEIGSGEHPNLSFNIHNDIRDGLWHVEQLCNCLDLKLPWYSCSIIKLNQVYEHFNYTEQRDLLLLCYRFLVSQGILIVYTPDLDYVLKLDPDDPWREELLFGGRTNEYDIHKRLVNRDLLMIDLIQCGFKIFNIDSKNGSLMCYALRDVLDVR